MLQQKVKELFASQLEQSPMARRNFDDLNSVQVAEVRFDACRMPVTFNAGRAGGRMARQRRQKRKVHIMHIIQNRFPFAGVLVVRVGSHFHVVLK